jgi:hypothetical protein
MKMISLKQRRIVTAMVCHAVLVPLARAHEFTLLTSQREIRTEAQGWMADGSGWYVNAIDDEFFKTSQFGDIDAEVSSSIGHISFGSGLARQESSVSTMGLGAASDLTSWTISMGVNAPARSLCTSAYIVNFSVATPTEVSLTGNVWVSPMDPDFNSQVFGSAMLMLTSLQSGTMHTISATKPGATSSISESFVLLPGQYRMEAHARTQLLTTSTNNPLNLGSQFDFNLTIIPAPSLATALLMSFPAIALRRRR